jgi:lipoprotein-anchoring transpeptidase ErfK/SrfK
VKLKPKPAVLWRIVLFLWPILFCAPQIAGTGQDYLLQPGQQVFGTVEEYVIQEEGETLVHLARQHDLGYNEITAANPDLDPWYPGMGKRVVIPTSWILPGFDNLYLDYSQLYFIVQTGSFSALEHAVRQYSEIASTMDNSSDYHLRIEKVDKYFAVRLGLFRERDDAERLQAQMTDRFAEAKVFRVKFIPAGIVYPEKLEVDTDAIPFKAKPRVVINLAEYRLYRITQTGDDETLSVMTFPIGIGREGNETSPGKYHLVGKKKNPAWIIPPSARADYPEYPGVMPPGPDNPLGAYALRLSRPDYLIHGTANPFGIGRRVSRGCIRMYDPDIEQLFNAAAIGDEVVITYQPIKVGRRGSIVYVEVHQDYLGTGNMLQQAVSLLKTSGLLPRIDVNTLFRLIRNKRGIPEPLFESSTAAAH